MSPTYAASTAARRGYDRLPRRQQDAFDRALDRLIAGLRDCLPSYHPSLRVKRHQASGPGVYELSVAPDGRLDVVYYDRRADPADRRNEVSLQSSVDGGQMFTDRLAVSQRSFDSRVGLGTERGLPDLGSRLALISGDDRALAVWPDTRAGTPASEKQDLARQLIAFPDPPRAHRRARAPAALHGARRHPRRAGPARRPDARPTRRQPPSRRPPRHRPAAPGPSAGRRGPLSGRLEAGARASRRHAARRRPSRRRPPAR